MIQLIGDIALTGLYVDDSENNYKRIEKIFPFFINKNLIIANLETPIFIENSRNPEKNKIHTTNFKALKDILIPLNINAVSLANNHIFDCSFPGIKATIEALNELGIKFTGAGLEKEHIEPIILNHLGKKIAFLAYVDPSTNPKTEKYPDLFINYFNLSKVKSDIKKIAHLADEIVCSIHWGKDYSFYPLEKQRKDAREIIESGATVIMGHHPHTIQPFEKYKNGFIFYSLGGLTFGDYQKKNNQYGALYKKTKNGLIVTIDLNRKIHFQTTFEKIGNYIIPSKLNYQKWNDLTWKYYTISEKYRFFKFLRNMKENVIDRIVEYFFGYYQNPLKRLFQLKNIFKLKKLF